MNDPWIVIGDGTLTAAINPLGAELSSLTDSQGREWMTDADPAFWTGRAPLLFPIVGALNEGRYRIDGTEYALPQHGFARRRRFDLLEAGERQARFRLSSDEQTRAVYPFPFDLQIAFRVEGGVLCMTCTLDNPGQAAMPYSFGWHPAFAWPLPGSPAKPGHVIRFDRPEREALMRLEGGLIAGRDRASPLAADGRTLALDDALFAEDALIWHRPESQGVDYLGPDGARLRIEYPEAEALGIWTKAGAGFVCIEPWWGHADPVGFTGDFRDKPGVAMLEPGQSRRWEMTVAVG